MEAGRPAIAASNSHRKDNANVRDTDHRRGTARQRSDAPHVGPQDVVKFRLASNARRRAENGSWEPGDSLYVNVNCWGRLVTGVAGTLKKGDAVIVVGNIHTSEYDDREGNRRSSLEMRATPSGPTCRCYIASLRRVEDLAGRDADASAGDGASEESAEEGGPLPLTA